MNNRLLEWYTKLNMVSWGRKWFDGYIKICYHRCEEYGVYILLPFLEEVSWPGSFLIYIAGLRIGELELDLNGGEGDGEGGSLLSILLSGCWNAARWVGKR